MFVSELKYGNEIKLLDIERNKTIGHFIQIVFWSLKLLLKMDLFIMLKGFSKNTEWLTYFQQQQEYFGTFRFNLAAIPN